jgi:hypothetical protein
MIHRVQEQQETITNLRESLKRFTTLNNVSIKDGK